MTLDLPRARFTDMTAGDQEDWNRIAGHFFPFVAKLPDRVLDHLRLLKGDHGGFIVDRLTHSLQTATRAQADGRDEEYVVCALLHDIGDSLGSFNHADIGAAILKPFVSPENHWMVANHDVFQGYYFFHFIGRDPDARDRFAGHPAYGRTAEFCAKYDAPSLRSRLRDPAARSLRAGAAAGALQSAQPVTTVSPRPLSAARLIAFAAPCVPVAALGLPITLYLPQFYAEQLGLGAVGAIFMIARLWDVILDPLMGFVSDRYPSRWGRRRPWIVVAVPIICLAAWFIFLPQGPASPAYLLGWMVTLYVGWTMLTIPHLAWAAELSGDYHQRSRIHAFREAAEIVGIPLVLAAPAVIEHLGGPNVAAHRLASMGLFIIVLLPIAVLLSVCLVKETPAPPQAKTAFREALRALTANGPLRTLVTADAISGAGGAALGALFVYVATDVWGLGRSASLIMLVYFFAGLGFVPLVVRASYRFGKRNTLIGCCAFYVVAPPLTLLIPHGGLVAASGLMVLLGVNVGGAGVLFRSIMADIVDIDELATGQRRTGLLYSFMALTRKGAGALAVGVTFWALQRIGFEPAGPNDAASVRNLALLFAVIPVICNIAVIGLMWCFPIGLEQQESVRRLLQARAEAGPNEARRRSV